MDPGKISQVIDDSYPPGSEERRALETAADAAAELLVRYGYGYLLEDSGPPGRTSGRSENP